MVRRTSSFFLERVLNTIVTLMVPNFFFCIQLYSFVLSTIFNFICSVEPGYYEDGKFGIRIENAVLCQKAKTKVGNFTLKSRGKTSLLITAEIF